jgi:dinuclear metal center YbgI/SA1388 family protein
MSASIKIKDVTDYLESLAPRSLQESYDNAGLLTGSPSVPVMGILVTLDCTEAVVKEAAERDCNLIVAHHPIIFKGLKRLSGNSYVERVVIESIKRDIAIYALHTNLDNVKNGVNRKIGEKIGLRNMRILVPRTDTLAKLVTFIPPQNLQDVLSAMYTAGAGQVGEYKNCSFSVEGQGTFTPGEGTQPHIGNAHHAETVDEIRVEVLVPNHRREAVLSALRAAHPYEEVAYYLTALSNENQDVGSGMIGELDRPVEPLEFLRGLKVSMELDTIRYTALPSHPIKKIAVCGGSGSFLLKNAIQAGAEAYVSADFKYHEFFDADGKILIADIGHYESEVFTKDLIVDVLTKKFPTFAINFSRTGTNPISYL